MWHLMGSAGCRAARLKSQSAKLTACYRIGAVIGSLPRASLRSGARFDLLFSNGSRDGGSFVSDIDACQVSAFSTCSCGTNGVSWVQSGSVEIAVGQTDRML